MFQMMTPIDYWRVSLAFWTRAVEAQVEMTRIAYGMAESWQDSLQVQPPPRAATPSKPAPVVRRKTAAKSKPVAAVTTLDSARRARRAPAARAVPPQPAEAKPVREKPAAEAVPKAAPKTARKKAAPSTRKQAAPEPSLATEVKAAPKKAAKPKPAKAASAKAAPDTGV